MLTSIFEAGMLACFGISWPIFGQLGCALCGLAVGIMWPGAISLSSKKCPNGGTAMFAFLALAGDFGAAVSPSMAGAISEMAGGNLKRGLLVATVFPFILVFALLILNKKNIKNVVADQKIEKQQ